MFNGLLALCTAREQWSETKPRIEMAETDGRLYGRHRAHSLSQRQQVLYDDLLPRLGIDLGEAAPNDLGKLFASPKSDMWLEIGFGAGEHLAWQAQQQPDIGIIGCEPYINGVAKLLSRIQLDGLQNIRIFDGDARPLLNWLPSASIGRVFLLFSDPWPKKRHRKRRFVTPVTLDQLARIMRPDAQLRIASDIGDFVSTTLLAIQSHDDFRWLDNGPSDWRSRPSDWPETRYEQKAIGAGRKPVYLSFARQ